MTAHSLPRRFCVTAAAICLAAGFWPPNAAGVRSHVAPAGGEQQPDAAFQLAMLRADAVLLPFASFDGDDWKSSWPQTIVGLDLPVDLAAVPRGWWGGQQPAAWRVWNRQGEVTGSVAPLSPVTILVGRAKRLGIRTDRPPDAVPVHPFQFPFPKAGLAVSGRVEVMPISSVSRLAPAWRALLPTVHGALQQAEERTLNLLGSNTGWGHPYDRRARAAVQAELEQWYTTSLVERSHRVSYIEAVKRYAPRPEDEGCGLETLITGWIHHADADARPKSELKAVVTYCDRDRASYMLPLGAIVVRNRTHWVFQMSGPDHEWYTVAELTPGRVRLVADYRAGGAVP